ncbi:hypothetical protein [Streptosporangium sp. CA-115845]|uniref:hypothetical protein n=1 Tax=Streptosporangium sp. CA-115845 TaxID=3240071 RepID=UPI003D8DE2F7
MISTYGYGVIKAQQGFGNSKSVELLVHRVVFEAERRPLLPGEQVDHTCHNEAAAQGTCAGGVTCLHRRCYRSDHLRATSQNDNIASSPYTMHRAKIRDGAGRFVAGTRRAVVVDQPDMLRNAIIDEVAKAGSEGVTRVQIIAVTGGSPKRVRLRMDDLRNAGVIERSSFGRNCTWRLCDRVAGQLPEEIQI